MDLGVGNPRWKVGEGQDRIQLQDLVLVSIHHVSTGSWQPQLRLRRGESSEGGGGGESLNQFATVTPLPVLTTAGDAGGAGQRYHVPATDPMLDQEPHFLPSTPGTTSAPFWHLVSPNEVTTFDRTDWSSEPAIETNIPRLLRPIIDPGEE